MARDLALLAWALAKSNAQRFVGFGEWFRIRAVSGCNERKTGNEGNTLEHIACVPLIIHNIWLLTGYNVNIGALLLNSKHLN